MNDDLWVFGYGSLIWRPGFEFVERRPALLRGLHRSLCLYSYVHRGTPEQPGLVAGLDHGGACRGVAFRVAAENREPVLAYLREREQLNYCYLEQYRTIKLDSDPENNGNGPRRTVSALCFVINRAHEQYCGGLGLKDKVALVLDGHGVSGPATDYLDSLIDSLNGLGIQDEGLMRLQLRVHETIGKTINNRETDQLVTS